MLFRSLSLYPCSTFMYVVPFVLFSKNEKLKQSALAYTTTFLLFGGLINFFLPDVLRSYPVLSFEGLHTLLYHYAILFISILLWVTNYYQPKKKENYLQNIGYLGEQLDLYLVSQNIGTLWFGIGKTDEPSFEGLDFVIMIAISKIDNEKKFRKDMFKSKRKSVDEIWIGEPMEGITDIIRFAPSACNTQPWIVEYNKSVLKVYRYKKQGKRGIMPVDKVSYYNQIDIGIFLCFLELIKFVFTFS